MSGSDRVLLDNESIGDIVSISTPSPHQRGKGSAGSTKTGYAVCPFPPPGVPAGRT